MKNLQEYHHGFLTEAPILKLEQLMPVSVSLRTYYGQAGEVMVANASTI